MMLGVATPAHSRGAIAALIRFDGRKLLTSPWFLAGLGLPALGSVVFFAAVLTKPGASWEEDGWVILVGFFLAAVFSMVAVNRAGLRDEREHAREQHEALPVDAATRALALSAATVWPAALTMGLFVAVAGFAANQVVVEWITVYRVLQTGALVVLLGALGVASASWIRNAFVGPVIGLALYFVHPGEVEASWHAIWPFSTFDAPALAVWHLAYLLGLALLFTMVATARFERRQAHVLTALAAVTLVSVSLAILMSSAVCVSTGPCSS